MKSEVKRPWNRDREWKVKWKCLEIEIEKWKFQNNSRETRLSQVTAKYTFPKTNRLLEIPALGAFSITVSQFLHNLPTWALIDGNDVCEDLEQSVYVASLPRWWWLWQLLTLGSDYEHGVFETLPSTGLTWTLNTVHPCKWWNTQSLTLVGTFSMMIVRIFIGFD